MPLVYTKAYTCYALKCAIAPEIPNNAASLEPFRMPRLPPASGKIWSSSGNGFAAVTDFDV